jgi:hypothetical protein
MGVGTRKGEPNPDGGGQGPDDADGADGGHCKSGGTDGSADTNATSDAGKAHGAADSSNATDAGTADPFDCKFAWGEPVPSGSLTSYTWLQFMRSWAGYEIMADGSIDSLDNSGF